MLTCLRCGGQWYRRTPNGPKRCPLCKSLRWRTQDGPLTQERVRELFDYHEDGHLIWKVKYHPGIEIGDRAGTVNHNGDGYYRIGVDGKSYRMHRLIWLWHKGYLPEGMLDHEDRDTTNSRIGNLREVSNQCNVRNCKVHCNNTTGITGVYKYPNKNSWIAFITDNGKRKHIGVFKSVQEAVMARHLKEIELNWKGCNSTSSAYLFLLENKIITRRRLL